MSDQDTKHAEETLDPEDWQATRRLGHQMVGEMMDYLETVRSRREDFDILVRETVGIGRQLVNCRMPTDEIPIKGERHETDWQNHRYSRCPRL